MSDEASGDDPRLSVIDWAVILDAILGSLRVADRIGIWTYPDDVRRQVAQRLADAMGRVTLDLADPAGPGA